jgi:hypothetical protein
MESTLNLLTIGFFIGCGYALSVVTFDLLGFAMLLTLRSIRPTKDD